MRRLAYQHAARVGRRETARLLARGRPPRRGSMAAGYALCAAVAVIGVLIGRTPAPVVQPASDRAPAAAAAIRVVDGDTLVVAGERIRIMNIDTPEMPPKARCAAEAEGALRARNHLQVLVASGPVTLERTGTDRYGRTLARVRVSGADAGRALVDAGLARRWEGRRRSWCA